MSVLHFRLEPGTRCDIRRPGSDRWEPYTVPSLLFHVKKRDEGGLWVFDTDEWSIRVAPELVLGQAADVAKRVMAPRPPADHDVVLTRDHVNAMRNGDSLLTRQQAALLGVSYPLRKGWLSGLLGRRISRELYDRLVALRPKLPDETPSLF